MTNNEFNVLYERVLHQDEHYQVRLTISEFRGTEYFNIRRYYLDFFEEWRPSSEGISMEMSIENMQEIFTGLVEILSLAESKSILEEYFSHIIDYVYQT